MPSYRRSLLWALTLLPHAPALDDWRAVAHNAYDSNSDLVLPLLDQFQAVRDGDGAELSKLSVPGNMDAAVIDGSITISLKPPQVLGAIGLWPPPSALGSDSGNGAEIPPVRPGWPVALTIDGKPLANATVNGDMDVSFDADGQLPSQHKADESLLIRLSPARHVAVLQVRALSRSPPLRLSGLMLFRYCEPISGCQRGEHACNKTAAGDLLVHCQRCKADYYRRHGKCRRCPELKHCTEENVRCAVDDWESFPRESTCEPLGCKPGFFGIRCEPCNITACGNFSCTKRADNCDYDRCTRGFNLQRGYFSTFCVPLSGPKKCRDLECFRAMRWLVSWMPSTGAAAIACFTGGVMHRTCGTFVYPMLALPSVLFALHGMVLHPRLQRLVTYAGAYGCVKAIPNALFGLSWAQSLFVAYLVQSDLVQRGAQQAWREVAPPSLQRFFADELPVLGDDLHECLHDRGMWPMYGVILSVGMVAACACLTIMPRLWARRFRQERPSGTTAIAGSSASSSAGGGAGRIEELELTAERDTLDELILKLQARRQRVEQLLTAEHSSRAKSTTKRVGSGQVGKHS